MHGKSTLHKAIRRRKGKRSLGSSLRLRAFGLDATITPDTAPKKGALCAPVNYALPGVFAARKQVSTTASWATQVTLLLGWRDDKGYTEEQALSIVGEKWVTRMAKAEALTDDETAMLIGSLGLCTPPPQMLSSEAWAAVLCLYGPVAIIEGDAGAVRFPSKGRIVIGIAGDGAPSATSLEIVDTSTGAPEKVTLEKLGGPYRLLHWHADAGLGCGARPTAPVTVDASKAPPAPAPDATTPPPAPTNGAHDPGHQPTQASLRRYGARAASIYARAYDVPAWDLPSAFPAEIRAFWAEPNSRMHHYIWHHARSNWPDLPKTQQDEILGLGFTAPPRLAGTETRSADPGAGVDFLNMHRHMVAATRALAISLGIQYRPTGWNPIPFEHNDPVWPMPTFPGSDRVDSKARTRTAYWKKMSESLRNPTWLAAQSLDALGTTLEEGIHNWFHMHWATQRPAQADLGKTSPSADYLGSTFSSQVNPIFWKLHGWIDECIEAWENAPVTAGTGKKRSAATELARFNWLGPIPKAGAKSGAKAFEAHEHGGLNLTDQQVQDLFARLQIPKQWEFPFADMPEQQLVARFGDVGPMTVAELDAIAPPDESVAVMASVRQARQERRGRRYVPVGFERHGVRAMDFGDDVKEKLKEVGIDTAIDLGRSIFRKLTARPEEGRFAVKSDIAEIMNADTPQIAPWTRTKAMFAFKATSPGSTLKDKARLDFSEDPKILRLMLSFEHNKFDLREARVVRQIQGSSEMSKGLFEISFTAKNATNKGSEVARIDFLITGKWDPGLGDKFFDISGKLTVEADGDMFLTLDANERVTIEPIGGDTFGEVAREALPPPTIIMKKLTMFFQVDKDVVEEGELQRLKDWVREAQQDDIRFRRLRDGTIPIFVEGHASATGAGQHNQDLSRKRANKVVALIKDEFGSKVDVRHAARGEANPATPKAKEKEDRGERRADVWFEIPQ